MTPDEQRIAIAETCGWKGPDHPDVRAWCNDKMNEAHCWWQMPNGKFTTPKIKNGNFGIVPIGLPDYLNDLNAMHEAEQVLTLVQLERMWLLLCEYFQPWRATAALRAEAFLRTIGKWKEAKTE